VPKAEFQRRPPSAILPFTVLALEAAYDGQDGSRGKLGMLTPGESFGDDAAQSATTTPSTPLF